ncbi:MAG: protein kinase [Chitinivibrionales bacterium]|nr:protein kinase [Chitinivibrionales bacterium]
MGYGPTEPKPTHGHVEQAQGGSGQRREPVRVRLSDPRSPFTFTYPFTRIPLFPIATPAYPVVSCGEVTAVAPERRIVRLPEPCMAERTQYKTPLVSIALERKLITEKQFEQCKELARKTRRIGLDTSMEELLVKQGYLSQDQLQELRHIAELGEGGSLFGAYRLGDLLGEGGMGKVYKAVHEVMNRTVALKVINYMHTRDRNGARRFYQEIRALAKLSHPSIVTIFDCGRVGKRHFFAMEYVDGPDLKHRVDKQGPLPERAGLRLLRQLAHALEHAHANKVIHRDVKPENILLRSDGTPKLTDFGLVMHHDADHMTLTQEGLMVGSYYYVSPEQIDGLRDIDGRSDIYSLGATFFYAFTGRTAYSGRTPQELVGQTLSGNLVPPNRYNHRLSTRTGRLIQKMMARNRDRRYQSMQEVIAEIDRALVPSRFQRALTQLIAGAALLFAGILAEHFFGVIARLGN